MCERNDQPSDPTAKIECLSTNDPWATVAESQCHDSFNVRTARLKKFILDIVVKILTTEFVVRQHSIVRVLFPPFSPGHVAIISNQNYTSLWYLAHPIIRV
jgi:hypothetical protein